MGLGKENREETGQPRGDRQDDGRQMGVVLALK